MAKMLQALKNLEARGERPGPPPAATPPAGNPPAPAALVATQAVTSLDFAAAQLDSLIVSVDVASLPGSERTPSDWSHTSDLASVVEDAFTGPDARGRESIAPFTEPSQPTPAAIDSRPPEVSDFRQDHIPQPGLEALSTEYPALDTPPALEGLLSEYSRTAGISGLARQAQSRPDQQASVPSTQYSVLSTEPAASPVAYVSSPPAPVAAQRPLTPIERAALRTLNNPIQARPLIDLADRLEADAKQTASHTLVFVSVGASRGSVEALVHAAAVLAERSYTDLLVVDADLSRRALTHALAEETGRGLSEAIQSGDISEDGCLPLATRQVRFLPAGQQPQIDAAATEARLEALLKSLGNTYGLVLIDGGQAGSAFTSTLARQADATYLVVELGAVEAPQAQEALRDLRAAGARVLGCIAT